MFLRLACRPAMCLLQWVSIPFCRAAARPTPPPNGDSPAAIVLHKGRFDELPSTMLLSALDSFTVSFGNEVFMVFSRTGQQIAADSPHFMHREAILAAALKAYEVKAAAPAREQRSRMPATYVGQGRVLLETVFGHLMLVSGADTAIVPHLIRDGFFDMNLTTVIGSYLAPGMTFIDIGANCGTYTLFRAGKVGPQGRAIAIEASPSISSLLLESVMLNGFFHHCDVVHCAAGAAPGKLVLHRFGTRQGGNTMLPHIAEKASKQYDETIIATEVECRTLDDIVAERGLTRIDLVKIDVEGFEREVLLGARAALLRHRPRIIIEWHNAFFEGRPGTAQALYDTLTRDLGYRLRRIEQDATTQPVVFEDLQHGHADLLAEPVT